MSDEKAIISRVYSFLDNYGVTPLNKAALMHFVKTQIADPENEKCNRIRKWLLYRINNKKIEAKSQLQTGCPEIIPDIRATPIWDNSEFSFIPKIKEMSSSIRSELLSLRNVTIPDTTKEGGNIGGLFQPYRSPNVNQEKEDDAEKGKNTIHGVKGTSTGDWNVLYLDLHTENFEENKKKCPITMNTLTTNIPRLYSHTLFSSLQPNTHIIKHHGPTNKKLRLHLPLLGCDGCKMRVGNEYIEMKQDEPYIFDDSFEHEVWHNGEKTRFVLIVDFWHPDLSDEEVKFLNILRNSKLRMEKKVCEQYKKECDTNFETYFDIIDANKSVLENNTKWWII